MSRVITFFINKKVKRPKNLGNNAFALYSPERLIIRPEDF